MQMKQTWLVVEDDPIIRSILTALMTLWGVDNIVFKDGHEAYRWLDAVENGDPSVRLPDIALLDIRMPGAQGHEIGKRMRSLPATQNIPIVIMTAYQLTREEREQIIEMAHPEHIIGKPLPAPDDLRAMLEKTARDAKSKRYKHVRLNVRQQQYRYLIDAPTSRRIAMEQNAKRINQPLAQVAVPPLSFRKFSSEVTPPLSHDQQATA
jgi:CheY-like chemotaxis protein